MKQMRFNWRLQGLNITSVQIQQASKSCRLLYYFGWNRPWNHHDSEIEPSPAYAGKQSASSLNSWICLEVCLRIFCMFCQSSVKRYTGPRDPMPRPEHNADGPLTFGAPCLRMASHKSHIRRYKHVCREQSGSYLYWRPRLCKCYQQTRTRGMRRHGTSAGQERPCDGTCRTD
jgi:hypothetical protein